MSKAFTREDDDGGPILVPARAPLPSGVPNYVTARGLGLLHEELARLEEERTRLEAVAGDDGDAESGDRVRRLALLNGRIGPLAERIGGATLVAPPAEAPDEVRFGATVTVRTPETAELRRFSIVGVDEADAGSGLVAFVSPVARALLGRRLGETVTLHAGRGDEDLEIVAIAAMPTPTG